MLLLSPLTACSGLPESASYEAVPLFQTHINEEGSKRFTFVAIAPGTLPRQLLDEGRPSPQQSRAHTGSEALGLALADHRYCHGGYIILSQSPWKIRGECNETATEADRTAFPNKASWQE